MKKKILLILVFILSLFTVSFIANTNDVFAATGYYSNISDTQTGTTLKQSLRSLITSTHTRITSYDDCKDPEIIRKTDGNEDSSQIVLFWSELEIDVNWDGGTTWNREHVWPQSQGWFETSGAGSDLHHIRPTDPSVNSSHNNNPYGYVNTNDYCTTSKVNGSIQTEAKCKNGYFEPSDSKKGDTARIIFYLLVRYAESDNYSITNVAQSMVMLLEWNKLDPVDASEVRRNEAVEDIQGNRNPFIDNSEYADLIWGGDNPDEPGSGSGSEITPSVPADGKVATFELGTNDTSKGDSSDSSQALSSYSETNNNYTLKLNNLSKVYKGFDASGNAALKLGTTSAVGSFNFDVPSNIDKVVILVAGYKSNKTTVTVNNNTQTISTFSSNSQYTNVEVDTTTLKNVSFTTTSSGYRCKINTIIYYDLDSASGTNNPIEDALNSFESSSTKASLFVNYSYESSNTEGAFGTYSYTFNSGIFTAPATKELNKVKWTLSNELLNANTTNWYGYENERGEQFGSAKNPFKKVSLITADNITDVTEISIYAAGASSTKAKLTAYVGGVMVGSTMSLTTSSTLYTFTCPTPMSGQIEFVITQTTAKAIYVKGLGYEYGDKSNLSEEYTLNSAGIRFGSYVTKEQFELLNSSDTLWGVEYAAGEATNLNSSLVKTVYCTPALVSNFNATETSSNGNYYQWSLVIENLNYTHIDKTISARMFVEYKGERYYMASSTQSIRTLVDSYLSMDLVEFKNHTGVLEHLKDY